MEQIYLPEANLGKSAMQKLFGIEGQGCPAEASSSAESIALPSPSDLLREPQEVRNRVELYCATYGHMALIELLLNALEDSRKAEEQYQWMIEHGANVLRRSRDGYWRCQWSDSQEESANFHDDGSWYLSAHEAIQAAMSLTSSPRSHAR